ncbi:epoxide hydrolase 1-like [Saccoglossus kowalevskii]|uniref:Epoxide hydrolase n=1 Tax=Saccoglossus kowalevskii TaxID=10224 RepID=A0ABM0GZL9_SACKO|nr:PREDICTED: epoxide hydrolase 1-like [Saccoglossus kowalevskii]
MGIKVTIFIVLVAIVTGLYFAGFLTSQPRVPEYGDGWWGNGEKPKGEENTSIRKFKINVDDSVIDDLKQRLVKTRWFEPLEEAKFHYGFNSTFMKTIVEYWTNKYDWKKQEKYLNQYEHFKTNIEGIDVHFMHVKPKGAIPSEKIKPLLMVHGWPGSFVEFYKIMPFLTEPKSHLGTDDDTFEVICPSIPGYGFSEAPHKQGFDVVAAARVFDKLMSRLGHEKYYYQGGDWGAGIGHALSLIQPSHVLGYHTNFPNGQPSLYPVRLAIGSVFPSLVGLDAEDVNRIYPVFDKLKLLLRETGYAHLQATKPDTAGFGLNDSPVGLAAYILEKFIFCTNPHYLDLHGGGLENHFTMDDLLTNVMIYWVNGNIVSSMRLYKESVPKILSGQLDAMPEVPVGIVIFKYELAYLPKTWCKLLFPNLLTYSRMQRGGHFAAFEEPQLLAEDIRKFVSEIVRRE